MCVYYVARISQINKQKGKLQKAHIKKNEKFNPFRKLFFVWQLEQASYQEIYELCKNTLVDDSMMMLCVAKKAGWQKRTIYKEGILLCTLLLRALPDLSKEKPLKHIMKMILCLHPHDDDDDDGWSVGIMVRQKIRIRGSAAKNSHTIRNFRCICQNNFRSQFSLVLLGRKTLWPLLHCIAYPRSHNELTLSVSATFCNWFLRPFFTFVRWLWTCYIMFLCQSTYIIEHQMFFKRLV